MAPLFQLQLLFVVVVTAVTTTTAAAIPYNYTVPNLPGPNIMATMGNPLKGLVGGSRWAALPLREDLVPLSMEFFNVGLSEVMTGDNIFDWTILDGLVAGAASRQKHCVMSFYIHWPGQPLKLPQYLIDVKNVTILPTATNGDSLDYQNADLQLALNQFITALGARYDADPRIAAVHVSLIGFWGEFHTSGSDSHLTKATQTLVLGWFLQAFPTTQLQARYPDDYTVPYNTLGFVDMSFAHSTLDGAPNNNVVRSWFFYPKLATAGKLDTWRVNMMGGETRPELQDEVFTESYTPGTVEFKQDWFLCANVTHMSYLLHHRAFSTGTTMDAFELARTRQGHAHLGYSYYVSQITATETSASSLQVAVTVEQIGIAPFYYDLGMEMRCGSWTGFQRGLETLLDQGDTLKLVFQDVPTSAQCLSSISLHLVSSFVTYESVPIKFAQGDGTLSFQLPLLNGETLPPSLAPSVAPTPAPWEPGTVVLFIKSNQPPDQQVFSITPTGTVFGSSSLNIVPPSGYGLDVFKYNRWAWGRLTYTITSNLLQPNTVYIMKLGFVELYTPNCQNNKRVMDISVNGVTMITGLDVYKSAGCEVGHIETITVSTDSVGDFVVTFIGKIENPMITFIEVFTAQLATGRPSATPSVKPTKFSFARPSRKPAPSPSSVPSSIPSRKLAKPSAMPSRKPSVMPSQQPSVRPSAKPSAKPLSAQPSARPSNKPSALPSRKPSAKPSRKPSSRPSASPSAIPLATCIISNSTNMLINGSFETPKVGAGRQAIFSPSQVPGWISQNNEKLEVWGTGRNGVYAVDGVNFLELDYRVATSTTTGTNILDVIYQDVRTTAGQYYEASFSIRARGTNFESENEKAIFSWNGVDTAFTAAGRSVWTKRTVIVVGTGGMDRFSLRESSAVGGSTGAGPLIDNVRLVTLSCTGTPRTATVRSGDTALASSEETTSSPAAAAAAAAAASSSSSSSILLSEWPVLLLRLGIYSVFILLSAMGL